MRRLGAEKVSQEVPPLLLPPSVFVSEKRTPSSLTLPAPLQEFVLTVIVGPQVRAKFSAFSHLWLIVRRCRGLPRSTPSESPVLATAPRCLVNAHSTVDRQPKPPVVAKPHAPLRVVVVLYHANVLPWNRHPRTQRRPKSKLGAGARRMVWRPRCPRASDRSRSS